MPFRSILFGDVEPGVETYSKAAPECFGDLRLNHVVSAATSGRDEYNLQPFFYAPLSDEAAIHYRHDVFRDLESDALRAHLHSFAERMRHMRAQLAQAEKLSYPLQKQRWFLDAVDTYCRTVKRLCGDLALCTLRAEGLQQFLEYLRSYVSSPAFSTIEADTTRIKRDLDSVRYSLEFVGNRIVVDRYDVEPDYGAEVLETFEKFKQTQARSITFDFSDYVEMNHVEAGVLGLVAQLNPDAFRELDEFYVNRRFYLDQKIRIFDREIQFYIAWLEYTSAFHSAGLPFCYPKIAANSKAVCARETFDLALAGTLPKQAGVVITNDFELSGQERIIVVSGPNQGGKTTFARTFGQLHYLARLGCPVPGRDAILLLWDRIFTHFEKEEDLQNLSGKLEDDLKRLHRILEQATPRSILIMNESFSSTTLSDALFLSRKIMAQIVEHDMLCVSVTFLDELATFAPSTVSMVSTVNPEDTSERTFKVIRRPADGLAYAEAIAAKYRLTYDSLKERITS